MALLQAEPIEIRNEYDLRIRVDDAPDAEVGVELVAWRVDFDPTGTADERSLADAAEKRSQLVGEARFVEEEPQVESLYGDPLCSAEKAIPSKG